MFLAGIHVHIMKHVSAMKCCSSYIFTNEVYFLYINIKGWNEWMIYIFPNFQLNIGGAWYLEFLDSWHLYHQYMKHLLNLMVIPHWVIFHLMSDNWNIQVVIFILYVDVFTMKGHDVTVNLLHASIHVCVHFLFESLCFLLGTSVLSSCMNYPAVCQNHLHIQNILSHRSIPHCIGSRGTGGTHTTQGGVRSGVCKQNQIVSRDTHKWDFITLLLHVNEFHWYTMYFYFPTIWKVLKIS